MVRVRVRKRKKMASIAAAGGLVLIGGVAVSAGAFIILSGVIAESAGILLGMVGFGLMAKADEIWSRA